MHYKPFLIILKILAVETIDIPEDIADEDGDALSYSLSGTDGSLFSISGNVVSFIGVLLIMKIHLIQMVTIFTI